MADIERQLGARALNAKYRAQYGITYFGMLGSQAMVQAYADQVGAHLQTAANTIVKAFGNQVLKDNRTVGNTFNEIGREAVQHIVEAFDSRHKPKSTSGYRAEERYSGGVLRRALGSSNMYRGSRDGLDFINMTWLNSQAKQWHRLNFGAGSRGGGDFRQLEPMRLFGEQLGIDLTLRNRPSGAFGIPIGLFMSPSGGPVPHSVTRRGTDAFYVLKGNPKKQTAGIRASRFLEAGVARINETLPLAQERLILSWARQARRTDSGPIAFINAPRSVIRTIERNAERTIREAYRSGQFTDLLRNIESMRGFRPR